MTEAQAAELLVLCQAISEQLDLLTQYARQIMLAAFWTCALITVRLIDYARRCVS